MRSASYSAGVMCHVDAVEVVDKALLITAISRPRQLGELAVALIPSVVGKSFGEAWRAISLTHMTRDPSGPSLHINT